MKKIKVGMFVAFNTLADAVWFEVMKVDGFRMEVRQEGVVDGRHYASHESDTSLVKQVRK